MVGLFTGFALRGTDRAASLSWFAVAAAAALTRAPALLALIAIQLGLSSLWLLPGIPGLLGPDPLLLLFEGGLVERLSLIVVRILLLMMVWNQFMFYRMLYGTAEASGLSEDLPVIPEVIPNRTDRLARLARICGALALASLWFLTFLSDSVDPALLANLTYTLVIMAIGLGAGSAFAPTRVRGVALTGAGLGLVVFLGLLVLGRFL
jgi:hypothetical protein